MFCRSGAVISLEQVCIMMLASLCQCCCVDAVEVPGPDSGSAVCLCCSCDSRECRRHSWIVAADVRRCVCVALPTSPTLYLSTLLSQNVVYLTTTTIRAQVGYTRSRKVCLQELCHDSIWHRGLLVSVSSVLSWTVPSGWGRQQAREALQTQWGTFQTTLTQLWC